jgi:hypothetical protein
MIATVYVATRGGEVIASSIDLEHLLMSLFKTMTPGGPDLLICVGTEVLAVVRGSDLVIIPTH